MVLDGRSALRRAKRRGRRLLRRSIRRLRTAHRRRGREGVTGRSLAEDAKLLDRWVAEGHVDPLEALAVFAAAVRAAGWRLLGSGRLSAVRLRWVRSSVARMLRRTVEGSRGIYLVGARLGRARAVTEQGSDELAYVMVADLSCLVRLADAEIARGGRRRGRVRRPLVVASTVADARRVDLQPALSVVRVAERHRRVHSGLVKRFPRAHVVTQPFPKAFSKGRTRMGDPEVSALAGDALASIHEAFERLGVRYFAEAGTLLGAIRDQKPIDWDDDVDLLVLGPMDPAAFLRTVDLERFDVRTGSMELRAGDRRRFGVSDVTTARRLKLHISKRGATYPRVTVSMAIAHLDHSASAWRYRGLGTILDVPAWMVERSHPVPFLGRTIPVPDGAEELLASLYGEDWRTPKIAWGPYEETLETVPRKRRKG